MFTYKLSHNLVVLLSTLRGRSIHSCNKYIHIYVYIYISIYIYISLLGILLYYSKENKTQKKKRKKVFSLL